MVLNERVSEEEEGETPPALCLHDRVNVTIPDL